MSRLLFAVYGVVVIAVAVVVVPLPTNKIGVGVILGAMLLGYLLTWNDEPPY